MPPHSVSSKWKTLATSFGMEEDVNKFKKLLLPFLYYYAEINPKGVQDFVRYYYLNDLQKKGEVTTYNNNKKETRRAAIGAWLFSPDSFWEKYQDFNKFSEEEMLAKIEEVIYTKVSSN